MKPSKRNYCLAGSVLGAGLIVTPLYDSVGAGFLLINSCVLAWILWERSSEWSPDTAYTRRDMLEFAGVTGVMSCALGVPLKLHLQFMGTPELSERMVEWGLGSGTNLGFVFMTVLFVLLGAVIGVLVAAVNYLWLRLYTSAVARFGRGREQGTGA